MEIPKEVAFRSAADGIARGNTQQECTVFAQPRDSRPGSRLVTTIVSVLWLAFCSLLLNAASYSEKWSWAYDSPPVGSCVGIDGEVSHSGSFSGFLKRAEDPEHQLIPHAIEFNQTALVAKTLKGRFARLRYYVKTTEVALVPVRVQGEATVRHLGGAFVLVEQWKDTTGAVRIASCQSPVLAGTTDWVQQELQWEMTQDATFLKIRFLLVGAGKIWVDDIGIEATKQVSPTLGCQEPIPYSGFMAYGWNRDLVHKAFGNLNFDEPTPPSLDWRRRRLCR